MHCNACDKILSDTELIWNKEIGTWELCSKCLEVAMEAAYSEGFQKPDEMVDEVEIIETEFDEDGPFYFPSGQDEEYD